MSEQKKRLSRSDRNLSGSTTVRVTKATRDLIAAASRDLGVIGAVLEGDGRHSRYARSRDIRDDDLIYHAIAELRAAVARRLELQSSTPPAPSTPPRANVDAEISPSTTTAVVAGDVLEPTRFDSRNFTGRPVAVESWPASLGDGDVIPRAD
jgi:hypothetical protein